MCLNKVDIEIETQTGGVHQTTKEQWSDPEKKRLAYLIAKYGRASWKELHEYYLKDGGKRTCLAVEAAYRKYQKITDEYVQ